MPNRVTRRRFLSAAASAAAGLVILRDPKSAWSFAANQKLNLALVGVGGRGSWFVGCVPQLGQNVAALCDVNEHKAAGAFKAFPNAPKFVDFRKLIDEAGKTFDAAIIATPDNTHAIIAMAMIKAGKHVYVEKPLTHDVYEARLLRQEAAARKVATQMGNQGTASESFRRCVDLIQAGSIGEVRQVYVFKDGGGPDRRDLPSERPPVPPTLHWDLWLGPAAERPYHPFWVNWHSWRDFATGNLGNWATHSMNCAFKALRLDTLWQQAKADDPNRPIVKIQAQTSGINKLSFPKWELIHYDFPARGAMPPVRITWSNGSRAPGMRDQIEQALGYQLDWGDAGAKKWVDHAGSLIVGSKGRIHLTGHNATHRLLPEDQFKDFVDPPRVLPRSRGHENEWFAACAGGPAAMSNFDYGSALTELLLLGNIATQFEQPLEYDVAAMKIANLPEAHALLKREYRKGWSL